MEAGPMAKSKTKHKRTPKHVLKLPDLEQSKSAVLNSLTSRSSQRTYDHAIREFIEWYCSEPRLAFNKTVVNQVEIQRQEVVAWLAFAEGKPEEALAGMRAAAELEDQTEKSAVMPGPLAPAREQLGELLLELKRPSEALKEFELTLVKEPNRFWSLYGTAESARLVGDRQTARIYFQKLLKTAERADQTGRRELAEAGSEVTPD
jgi:tetratricopeptide (TPR) repeat protein